MNHYKKYPLFLNIEITASTFFKYEHGNEKHFIICLFITYQLLNKLQICFICEPSTNNVYDNLNLI